MLWVDDDNQPQSYHLTTVTYGIRPASYLAGRVLKQLIIDKRDEYPLAVEPFEKGNYVDDICGALYFWIKITQHEYFKNEISLLVDDYKILNLTRIVNLHQYKQRIFICLISSSPMHMLAQCMEARN